MKNKLYTAVLGVAIAVLIITFSIGLPIYFRPFYFSQIEELDLPEKTGLTEEEIKEAYNELLDYLTLPGHEFGTGKFKYSESGKSHFVDCKVLFDLNATALIISLIAVGLMLALKGRLGITLSRPFGLDIGFSSGLFTLLLFGTVAGLCAIDFNTAFTVFHSIFFPGKTNWRFNSRTDEIIKALPQTFFMRCAVLIVASIVILSLLLIAIEVTRKILKNKRSRRI